MVVKGEIPVLEQDYDLTDASGFMDTGKNVVAGVIGVTMLLGVFAGGRALWNRISSKTSQVDKVEVF